MNLRPGLYAQRCLSFVLLLLWCGFAASAPDCTSLMATGAALFTPFVATGAPFMSALVASSASLLTPFRALCASFLTPFCAGLRAGRRWGGCLCLGLSLRCC
jgi:hypothetical protein